MPYDFAALLGIPGIDLKENCVSDAINMWSPRKPIYSTKIVLDADDFKGGAHTVSGYKTGAGILKPVWSGSQYINDFTSHSDGQVSDAVWTLDKPILDGQCFFRLTDFVGYWHHASRMFTIGTIFGNVSNIIIPSSDSIPGSNISFMMYFSVQTGTIVAQELFGDCWSNNNQFYPGVIMSCGAYGLHYVKTTDEPISAFVSSAATININTRDFMNQMKSDWLVNHAGNPYESWPFRTGDKWTGCVVLLSRVFTGGDSYNHKLNGEESIVRLEYASPSGDSHVDRKTLPILQTKNRVIEWMKMRITISRQGEQNGYDIYSISSIVVTAKLLSTESVGFRIDADPLMVPKGYVNIVNTASGPSVTLVGYSNINFSGTVGEVSTTLSITSTQFYVSQSATIGNKLCNGTLKFVDSSLGYFSGVFSIDVSSQSSQYTRETSII